MTLETVLAAFNAQPVKSKTNEWLGICPVHGDRNPSLAITQKAGGMILLCCRSQRCTAEDIMAAVGLEMSDLLSSKPDDYSSPDRKSEIVATYDYPDESGEMLYQVVRYEPGKDGGKKSFSQRRPDDRGGWIWSLGDVRRVLYRLPEIVPPLGKTIYLPEGEKDVETLRKWNLTATTNARGALEWRPEYTEALRGAHVVILPDNDEAGRKRRDRLGAELTGVAASVHVLELPDLPEKCDVSDWVAKGGTLNQFAQLVESAPAWVAPVPAEAVEVPPVAPPVLDSAALYGLIGDFIRIWQKHTEACVPAMLVQLLIAIGNMIGRTPIYRVSGMKHHTNLYGVIVGQSAKARKGTSFAPVRGLLEIVNNDYAMKRVRSGVSSGEGIIYEVRDPVEKNTLNKKTQEMETVTVDEGVKDKRLFLIESEFASVLQVMSRSGNTVSEQLRNAYDTGNLATLTKNTPLTATNAHISFAGHITADELRRKMTECDTVNGFGNRFLWVHAFRAQYLPFGGEPDRDALFELADDIHNAVSFASEVRLVGFHPDTRAAWGKVYRELERDVPGLAGTLTSRGTPNVIRMAMIYALLDKSDTIRMPHLAAALAVWGYCEQSARYIFGESSGDPIADDILRNLRKTPEGMTRTDISKSFGGNLPAARLIVALNTLEERGCVRCEKRPAESGSGRPADVWKAVLDE